MGRYIYSAANRLISVSDSANETLYEYNGTGDRVSQTVNDVTIHYALDLAAGLTQVLADNDYYYLYGNGRIAQYNFTGRHSATPIEYFLTDALGSVRQLVMIEPITR